MWRQRALIKTGATRWFSSTTTMEPINYLVIDGYAKEGRENLRAGGAGTGGDLYVKMLQKCTPGDAEVDVVFPADEGFEFPPLEKYHAVAWTGCSLTIHDETDRRVIPQIEFSKHCFQYGIPQFGSCWALQIAAVVAGGKCARNPLGREMGIARKISLTPDGRAHPMFEGKPATFDAFTSHEDEVTHMPATGLNLGGNFFTAVQALSVRYLNGDFWAIQYHPEYDLHELARLTHCRREKLIGMGMFKDMETADAYVKDLEALHADNARYDISWRLGIDSDVMDEGIRLCEVRNFVKHLVLPYKANKEHIPNFYQS